MMKSKSQTVSLVLSMLMVLTMSLQPIDVIAQSIPPIENQLDNVESQWLETSEEQSSTVEDSSTSSSLPTEQSESNTSSNSKTEQPEASLSQDSSASISGFVMPPKTSEPSSLPQSEISGGQVVPEPVVAAQDENTNFEHLPGSSLENLTPDMYKEVITGLDPTIRYEFRENANIFSGTNWRQAPSGSTEISIGSNLLTYQTFLLEIRESAQNGQPASHIISYTFGKRPATPNFYSVAFSYNRSIDKYVMQGWTSGQEFSLDSGETWTPCTR